MIRNCPNRLEFKKTQCYSTVNQSISKKTSIFALISWEEQRLNRFWSKKGAKNLLSLLAPKKVSSLLLFNTYLVMWKYNCEPLSRPVANTIIWRPSSTSLSSVVIRRLLHFDLFRNRESIGTNINRYNAKLLVFWEKIIHAQLLNVADDGFSYL